MFFMPDSMPLGDELSVADTDSVTVSWSVGMLGLIVGFCISGASTSIWNRTGTSVRLKFFAVSFAAPQTQTLWFVADISILSLSIAGAVSYAP